MTSTKRKTICTNIKTRLYESASSRIGPGADWVQKHIADCPKCRRRLASLSRVDLALSMIKAQPHSLELLRRANEKAVGVLKHGLRQQPKAQKLKNALPEPKFSEKCGRYARSGANAAACIAILFLTKTGIFGSMAKFQSEGQEVMKQYYAHQVGQDISDDIFTA